MADDRPQDAPTPDSSNSGDSSGITSDDIESLVDQSAILMNTLAEEIGGEVDSDSTPSSARSDGNTLASANTFDDATDDATPAQADQRVDVGQQLQNVDELLATAADELGCAAQGSRAPHGIGNSDGGQSGTSDEWNSAAGFAANKNPQTDSPAIPDFMAEFTQVEDSTGSENELDRGTPRQRGSSRTAYGDVDSSEWQANVVPNFDDGTMGLDDAMQPGALPADDPHGVDQELPTSTKSRLATLVFAAGQQGASALERVDRPFRRVGPRLRYLFGLIALATLGTALITLLISIL